MQSWRKHTGMFRYVNTRPAWGPAALINFEALLIIIFTKFVDGGDVDGGGMSDNPCLITHGLITHGLITHGSAVLIRTRGYYTAIVNGIPQDNFNK